MIVGLVGYAQVGKDTCCKVMGWKRLAFADVLKMEAMNALQSIGIDVNLIKDNEAKKEWRGFLVDLGEWKRKHVSKYYWSDIIKEYLMDHQDDSGVICVTDCRYTSEVEMLERLGAVIIFISRPGYTPANPVESYSIGEILSRHRVIIIENKGTIDDLKSRVEELPCFANLKI